MSTHHTLRVGDHNIFYREAGTPGAPALLLLHGFPTSSHMYRNLLPKLADRFHLIAPDLPGFGFTESPARGQFAYTFENITQVMRQFVDAVGLKQYGLYIFDYGAPVGLRLAAAEPDRVTAIVSQNGNAYVEGLSAGWNPIQKYWESPTDENRLALRGLLTLDSLKWQYSHGASDPALIAPEAYTLDHALLQREGNEAIQLDLFLDYQSNVSQYPAFQRYFAQRRPPLLAVWGKNDPFFVPAGAEQFPRDNPNAVVKFIDTGHFALETHAGQIAAEIRSFYAGLA